MAMQVYRENQILDASSLLCNLTKIQSNACSVAEVQAHVLDPWLRLRSGTSFAVYAPRNVDRLDHGLLFFF
jgi:hypothetical protein